MALFFCIIFSFKEIVKISVIVLVLLALFLIPLVQNNWTTLYNGFKYYSISGLGEWNHLGDNNLPVHLFNGNGFACFFYSFAKGSLETRFHFLQKTHFILVCFSTICLSLVYLFLRKKINNSIFLVCALKIYFVVFYGFLQVPYNYLFVVPLSVSIAILCIVNYYNYLLLEEINL